MNTINNKEWLDYIQAHVPSKCGPKIFLAACDMGEDDMNTVMMDFAIHTVSINSVDKADYSIVIISSTNRSLYTEPCDTGVINMILPLHATTDCTLEIIKQGLKLCDGVTHLNGIVVDNPSLCQLTSCMYIAKDLNIPMLIVERGHSSNMYKSPIYIAQEAVDINVANTDGDRMFKVIPFKSVARDIRTGQLRDLLTEEMREELKNG